MREDSVDIEFVPAVLPCVLVSSSLHVVPLLDVAYHHQFASVLSSHVQIKLSINNLPKRKQIGLDK
jgi:hypothetical protein